MLHAGVLKKFGLYGLMQIALPLLPFGALALEPYARGPGGRRQRARRSDL
jgi:NADH:ubiquinone oxidoreductase subunit 4 (subunit M)